MIGATSFDADARETSMTIADALRKPESHSESPTRDSLKKLVLASDDETRSQWA